MIPHFVTAPFFVEALSACCCLQWSVLFISSALQLISPKLQLTVLTLNSEN